MMKAINHPGVLQLEEIFEGDNSIYTVTHLYSGPKLSDVITEPGYLLDDRTVSTVCLRLLEALAHLESRKIIHRDLKPDNIVFRDQNDLLDPVLVDLGFATFVEDYAYLFTRCGTPGYVAPEVLLDQRYDCKADIFSLGVTLYMMMSQGFNPFMCDDYQGLVDNNAAGVVDYSCIEDRWLTPLIQQMLEPNPENRLSASQIIKAYGHILAAGPEPVEACVAELRGDEAVMNVGDVDVMAESYSENIKVKQVADVGVESPTAVSGTQQSSAASSIPTETYAQLQQ